MPWVLDVPLLGAAAAMFYSLGTIASYVTLNPDPIEAQAHEVLPLLSGELHGLVSRLSRLHRQCRDALAALPPDRARGELAETLTTITQQAIGLAREWSGLEAAFESDAREQFDQEAAQLRLRASRLADPIARSQLETAAGTLQGESTRLGKLIRGRDRIVAKLHAQIALVEGARITLLGIRGGRVQLKAAELSSLALRLSAQNGAQALERTFIEEAVTDIETLGAAQISR